MAAGQRRALDALPSTGRLRDMQRRLERRLERAGLPQAGRERVLAGSAAALAHRLTVIADEEHFEVLHPARTLLIMLDDCGVTDVRLLEAASAVESEHPRLRVGTDNVLARAVPFPDPTSELLERLVVADEGIRLLALAERLDHARHLHLREPVDWVPFHALVDDVYAPVARRTHARLSRRYEWWRRMFARRFLARDGAVARR